MTKSMIRETDESQMNYFTIQNNNKEYTQMDRETELKFRIN